MLRGLYVTTLQAAGLIDHTPVSGSLNYMHLVMVHVHLTWLPSAFIPHFSYQLAPALYPQLSNCPPATTSHLALPAKLCMCCPPSGEAQSAPWWRLMRLGGDEDECYVDGLSRH